MSALKVLIFSDVVCPWCYLGVTRLERAAALHTIITGQPVEISLRAYQFDPEAPAEAVPARAYYERELGGREEAEAEIRKIEAAGKITGIDFDFTEAVRGNTFDAHRMLTWAETTGSGTQRDLAHELWRAHFLEGADVSDHDTLAARAGIVGLDIDRADEILAGDDFADEVRMQLATAEEMGIDSVPMIVIDGKYAIQGSQSQDDYVEALGNIAAEIEDSAGE
ncbi:MAG: DsbA family oxidoreductase [Aeromicrobium sp.]